MRSGLSDSFMEVSVCGKREKKGRAKRGIVTRIRRGIEEAEIEEEDVNRVPERRLRIDEEIWSVNSI